MQTLYKTYKFKPQNGHNLSGTIALSAHRGKGGKWRVFPRQHFLNLKVHTTPLGVL